jgi:hypothetical protein
MALILPSQSICVTMGLVLLTNIYLQHFTGCPGIGPQDVFAEIIVIFKSLYKGNVLPSLFLLRQFSKGRKKARDFAL